MSRRLTGEALAEALGKAAQAAIAGAVEDKAAQLQQAFEDVGASRDAPSPPLWGREGEGGEPPPSPDGSHSAPAAPLPGPPPQGGRGNPTPRLVSVKTSSRRTTLILSAPNLFAREFGALGAVADPILEPAIRAIRRRPR